MDPVEHVGPNGQNTQLCWLLLTDRGGEGLLEPEESAEQRTAECQHRDEKQKDAICSRSGTSAMKKSVQALPGSVKSTATHSTLQNKKTSQLMQRSNTK